MKTHQTYLELAAMAIDFPLAPAERSRLEQHLAGCPDCVRSTAALRSDAVAIGRLAPVTLPARRGDEILAAALQPRAVRGTLRLVLVAALLGLLLIGSAAAGAVLLHRSEDDLSLVLPVPSATASPNASAAATASPSPAPVPAGVLAVTHGDETGGTWVEQVTLKTEEVAPLGMGGDPAWFGDGRLVYACAKKLGENTTICMVNSAQELQPEIASGATQPAPAPDGSLIAVHRGSIDVGETWLLRPDGKDLHRLAAGSFLRWSPDGAWLMGQPESATFQVAIIPATGGTPRVLAPGYDPAWSPSGNAIVYAAVGDQGASLRRVNVASGKSDALYAAPAGAELAAPAWLGDGGWVFVQDGNVWRLDAGASAPVQVTTGLAIPAVSSGGSPAVSADGRWVAVTDGTGANARVGIASVDGGTDITWLAAGTSGPRWAPATATRVPTPSAQPGPTGLLGDTWVHATLPVAAGRPVGLVEAVTAGGPGFVAVGRGCLTGGAKDVCEGVVWTSVDGRTWARPPASDATDTGLAFPSSGPEIGMYDVAAGTPGVVAIGYAARPDMQATIWFSPDGASWERIPLGLDGSGSSAGAAIPARVNAVAWDGRSFVVVGEDRSDFTGGNVKTAKARAAVWTSSDGRNWARVPHAAVFDVGGFVDTLEDPGSGGMSDVVAGPSGLVAVGSACDVKPAGCKPAAWTSTDGTSWERTPGVPSLTGVLKAVAATGAGYVAVGPGLVLASSDGRAWARKAFDLVSDLSTVTTIGGRLFATSPEGPVTVWMSDDGTEWAPPVLDGGPAVEGQGTAAAWHLAVTTDVAVLLGSPTGSDNPAAWVSGAATAP